jgi:proline iminopeptidase
VDEERYIKSEGARLWSTASGSGPAMLMFNGGPGCDDYLQPVAELVDDIVRTIRFEPRGCGRSAWDGRYDLDTLLTDAEALRTAYGVERWIAAGHSMGPNWALAYALRHPERVIGVIGIAGGKVIDDREWSATYSTRRDTIGEDLAGKVWHADPEVNPQGNAQWKAYSRRPRLFRELADMQLPCVFINASQDIRPNWPTQQLAELIPGGRCVEILGATHHIWLTHARELRAALRDAIQYLSHVDAASAPTG